MGELGNEPIEAKKREGGVGGGGWGRVGRGYNSPGNLLQHSGF